MRDSLILKNKTIKRIQDGPTNLEQPTLNHVQSDTIASADLADPSGALQGTNWGSGPAMEESENDLGSLEQLLLYADEHYLAGKLPLGDHLGKVLHGVEEYHQRKIGPLWFHASKLKVDRLSYAMPLRPLHHLCEQCDRTVWGGIVLLTRHLHTRTRLSPVPKTIRDSSLNTTFCQSVTFHIDLAWHHCRDAVADVPVLKGVHRKGCLI
ncbi:15-hydroxyprostaglandin dehydrogenase [Trichonephila clavipes]|nr:15-hydroxyprostaglandin dehydrogenase [Trichonephila clavipes]